MTSTGASTDETQAALSAILTNAPDVLEQLTAAHQAALAATDSRLLELCRLRMATLLGNPVQARSDTVDPATVDELPKWPTSASFDDTDRACLAFAEQFVIDVASLSDDTATAVSSRLGNDGFVNFVNSLLVIEQRQRLHLIWGRLFPEETT